MLLAATLVLELVRESLTGTHYRYRQYEQGLPTDTYITTKAPLQQTNVARASDRPESLRLVNGRQVRRRIVHESPFQPWQEDLDAATGAVIERTPLYFNAKPARIFDPNPVVTLNAPELQDLNDAPVPAAAYKDIELPDSPLHGPWADVVDRQAPFIAPPEGSLLFDRTDDGFEPVNAYAHIHRNQEWVQSLGYRGTRAIAPYAVPVDAHAASGADNSFFIPSSTQAGRGTLFYGDGGTDDAEDADIVVHEYSHALMEWISPGTFGGTFGSETRALSEGTADYWAFSAHLDARRASGRDLYCFADWDARCWLDAASEGCAYPPNSDCLRRLDSALTMADYTRSDLSGTEHHNGAIWSSALREIREQLPRDAADTIVLESFFGAPPNPTFAVMARRLIEADRELYQAEHANVICAAMTRRGILADCAIAMRGERTFFQNRDLSVAIPDNNDAGITSAIRIDDARAIERLSVRVDIAHPARGDLRIELIAPDGTVILLQPISNSIAPDIHTTYGLTATPAESLDVLRGRSAAGTWTLHVSDRKPRDAGTLTSWGLDIRFAGDEPQTSRPRGTGPMIPVVAHLYGQSGAHVSDVRIFNPGVAQTITLIYTPSTKNGLEEFLALRVFIGAEQLLVLDDVVDRTFHTAGSGSLQILGDVIATSRLYVTTPGGTLGHDVPADVELSSTDAAVAPLLVAPFAEPGTRYNLGITEIAGARGVIRAGDREFAIEPFSQVQFPVGPGLQEIRVVSGGASVIAYLSQIRNDDAMFVAATREPSSGYAPAITAQLSGTPEWRSDLWLAGPPGAAANVAIVGDGERPVESPAQLPDVLALLFHRTVTAAAMNVSVPAATFASTRIVHGATTQGVPLLRLRGGVQNILFVANDADYRTNVAIVTAAVATVEILTYDGSGALVDFRAATLLAPGLHQFAVTRPIANGRVAVRFVEGTGRAYGSLIDRRSGDATLIIGQ
jgi:subtilisin-like proprotein convertase family protein